MKRATKFPARLVVLQSNDPISAETEEIQSRIRERAYELSRERGHAGREVDDKLIFQAGRGIEDGAAAAGHQRRRPAPLDRGAEIPQESGAAVTVALAAPDYPARGDSGTPISGVEDAESGGALVFHAGTARHGSSLVTNGGRILGVTGAGETVAEAREQAYAAIDKISFEGMRYRSDIAAGVDE